MSETARTVFTIGHSTRTIEEFIGMLQAHEVSCVADVRTLPRSKRHPQFDRETLPGSLRGAAIAYVHLPGLGGLRRPRPDSANTGWRNTSFRGFADYMQTPEFTQNLEELVEFARQERVALMCAEAVPWRCHRSLIADALVVRGFQVEDIVSERRRRTVHRLTHFAKLEGTRVTYPAEESV